jgi:hypothetical protein
MAGRIQPKSNPLRRLVATKTWVRNGRDVVDLPRGYDLSSLYVEVTGTIQLTTAATTAALLAPAQLMNKFTLRANGNQSLTEILGIVAAVSNFERQLQRTLIPPGVGIATHTVYAGFRLDRINADGPRPKDSALHTSGRYMNLLQLQMDYGTEAACWSVFGAGVLGVVALTVNVYTDEIQEFTADAVEGRFIKRETYQDVSPPGANAAFLVPLPIGSMLRGVKVLALDSTTNEPTSAKLNNLRIRSGANVRLDMSLAALRAQNEVDYGIQGAQLSGIPGLAFGDLLVNGRLNTLFDLRSASECFAELNVPAGARVILTVTNFDPPPVG